MKKKPVKRIKRRARDEQSQYVLRLFITGSTARSARSIYNIRNLCDDRLHGRYQLEVVDIYQQPEMARQEQIVAAPTLIKELPPPLRRLVGDLSDTERVVAGLDLNADSV